jgi:FkbH-like protein
VTPPLRLLVVSDFQVDNLCGQLRNRLDPPNEVVAAPFAQVLPTLLDAELPCWSPAPDAALVWTLPEAVIPSFARILAGQRVEVDELVAEVRQFASAIRAAAARLKWVIVPSWATPRSPSLAFASLEMQPGVGVAASLMRMNLALVEALAGSGVTVLDASRWLRAPTAELFSPKRWYLAKLPFGNAVVREAARDLAELVRNRLGRARKLILVDLDDTIWGGILGDEGWENLRLGGHDPVGEAHVDFQRGLAALQQRGILLGVVSKNTEAIALEAMRAHPEMVLRPEDLVGWRINWDDKARNVAELVAELRLGLDAVVFIDDNPFERARLAEALPEVLVPDWPRDPMLYRAALDALTCFDAVELSGEDLERTRLYAQERSRATEQASFASVDEWLATLETTVRVEALDEANLARVAQLLNKTNQLNLRTRRMTEAELRRWAELPGCSVHAFRVRDRFGEAGLTGILGLRIAGELALVEDFVLSCRVMGRKVEETIVHVASELAREAGSRILRAEYLPSAKNGPCLAFWRRSGLASEGEGETGAIRFAWSLEQTYPLPSVVSLERSP